jgi:hypothetical protein
VRYFFQQRKLWVKGVGPLPCLARNLGCCSISLCGDPRFKHRLGLRSWVYDCYITIHVQALRLHYHFNPPLVSTNIHPSETDHLHSARLRRCCWTANSQLGSCRRVGWEETQPRVDTCPPNTRLSKRITVMEEIGIIDGLCLLQIGDIFRRQSRAHLCPPVPARDQPKNVLSMITITLDP